MTEIVFLAPARQLIKNLSLMALFVLSLALTQARFGVEFKIIVGTEFILFLGDIKLAEI